MAHAASTSVAFLCVLCGERFFSPTVAQNTNQPFKSNNIPTKTPEMNQSRTTTALNNINNLTPNTMTGSPKWKSTTPRKKLSRPAPEECLSLAAQPRCRIPLMNDSNQPPDMFSAPPQEKSSRLPWIIAGGVVLVVIGVLIFFGYTQSSSAPGPNAPLSPYASNLAISGIQMSQAKTMVGGQSTYIDGTITNKGSKTVTRVTLQAIFYDFNNHPTQVSNVQLQRIRTHVPYTDTEPLANAPIAPGQSAPFRLILDHVTDSWNQNPPTLRIIQVSFQ